MDLASFNALNARGESQAYERKVDGQWQSGLKGVCAMVNANGRGVLALGVRDDGSIAGVGGDLDAMMRSRSQTIAAKFSPTLVHRWWVVPHPDGKVLVLEAERAPGSDVHEYDGRVYLREGTQNRQLTIGEAMALVRARTAGPLVGPHRCPNCGYRSALGMQVGGTITIGAGGVVTSWTGHDSCPQCGAKLVRA